MRKTTITGKLSEDEVSSLEKATGVSRWRIGRIDDNPLSLYVGVDRTIVNFTYVESVDNDDIAPLLSRFRGDDDDAPTTRVSVNGGTGFFARIREWWNRQRYLFQKMREIKRELREAKPNAA